MRQSTRLTVNTIVTIARLPFTVCIGLLVTRLLLQFLGKIDFGLILAIGASGAMLQFVADALVGSVQRQLAIKIAYDDSDGVRRAFSTVWLVFIGLGAGLWSIGEALTPLVMHGLTIPPDRLDAAWWVYQISLLNLLLIVTATPYRALIVAHQHMVVNAVGDTCLSVARLVAVLLLVVSPWDLMVSFVAFQLAGYAIIRWAINIFCLWRYEGCWPKLRNFDRMQFKEIMSIAIWSLLNQMGWRLRMQGGILMLNVFFGPAVNAAYGITTQIVGVFSKLAHAIRLSVQPAIAQAHAKGQKQTVQRLALVTGKYTVLFSSIVFVPVALEIERLLQLWLGDFPEYTIILSRIVLVWVHMNGFVAGYQLALLATGDIGWFTRRTGLLAIGILAIAGSGFYFGMPPWFLPVSACLGSAVLISIAVFGIGAVIELPPRQWLRDALLPTLGVLLPATACAMLIHWLLPESLWRVGAVMMTYAVVAAPLVWLIALALWEREQFVRIASSTFVRLQHLNSANSAK